jgi:FixJ family two-component response regulator
MVRSFRSPRPRPVRTLSNVPLIAIVDDDVWARGGLATLLHSMGFESRTFVSAEQFLEAGCAATTACLITDLNMPGMGGLALLRTLRSAGHLVPTILITGYANELGHARAVDAGAAAVLIKPFDPDQLIDCLRQLLAAR